MITTAKEYFEQKMGGIHFSDEIFKEDIIIGLDEYADLKTKQLDEQYNLSMPILLLKVYHESFKKHEVGFHETQKAIDTLTALQQKLES